MYICDIIIMESNKIHFDWSVIIFFRPSKLNGRFVLLFNQQTKSTQKDKQMHETVIIHIHIRVKLKWATICREKEIAICNTLNFLILLVSKTFGKSCNFVIKHLSYRLNCFWAILIYVTQSSHMIRIWNAVPIIRFISIFSNSIVLKKYSFLWWFCLFFTILTSRFMLFYHENLLILKSFLLASQIRCCKSLNDVRLENSNSIISCWFDC